MVETWALWLFLVGLASGVLVTLLVVVRLPRSEVDVSASERPTEAAWISAIIERDGGIAPVLLVEEVLELHRAYLREARPPVPPTAGQASLPGIADPTMRPLYQPTGAPPVAPTLPPGAKGPGGPLPGRQLPPATPPRRR